MHLAYCVNDKIIQAKQELKTLNVENNITSLTETVH